MSVFGNGREKWEKSLLTLYWKELRADWGIGGRVPVLRQFRRRICANVRVK